MPQATLLCLGETACTKPVGNEMGKASQPAPNPLEMRWERPHSQSGCYLRRQPTLAPAVIQTIRLPA